MAGPNDSLDRVLDKLIRDVEQAVHALYRGDVRQQTAKARTDTHRVAARKALQELLDGAPGAAAVPAPATGRGGVSFAPAPPLAFGPPPAPGTAFNAPASGGMAGGHLSPDEAAALTKCIMAWLPMGAPSGAAPESRCVAAGKELIPSWGERELAREALRRVAPKRA